MVKNRQCIFTIRVTDNMETVLSLLTRKKEYFLITAPERILSGGESELQYEFRSSALEKAGTRQFLYIGGDAASRDEVKPDDYRKYSGLIRLREGGAEITHDSVPELYRAAEGKSLTVRIKADDERAASDAFLNEMLRLGVNPGQWYISRSFAKMDVLISDAVAAGGPVKPGDYDACDEIMKRLEINSRGYGDDRVIKYEVGSENDSACYFVMESYYNHCWYHDPAGILTVRLHAELSEEPCRPEDIRFAHPSKCTRNSLTGKPALIRSIRMDCSEVEGAGYIKRIRKNQVFDNLSDLSAWLYFYHQDIRLA